MAAKVPANTGILGEFLGRAVVKLMGTEGVSEDDPLIRLDRVKDALSK